MADVDQPPVKPALAKVTIFEVAERPWGWLTTSAQVDDRVYVGSWEWRRQQNVGFHLLRVPSRERACVEGAPRVFDAIPAPSRRGPGVYARTRFAIFGKDFKETLSPKRQTDFFSQQTNLPQR